MKEYENVSQLISNDTDAMHSIRGFAPSFNVSANPRQRQRLQYARQAEKLSSGSGK